MRKNLDRSVLTAKTWTFGLGATCGLLLALGNVVVPRSASAKAVRPSKRRAHPVQVHDGIDARKAHQLRRILCKPKPGLPELWLRGSGDKTATVAQRSTTRCALET